MGVWMKININPKRYLHLHVHPDIIYNSQDTETAWVPITGWMDKENVVYVHWNTCCCAITKSCPTLCNPMDCTCQAPLSMGFSRQEYWSGLSFPPPEDLLDPWIEPTSPVSPALAGRFFTAEPPEKPNCIAQGIIFNTLYNLNGKESEKESHLKHCKSTTIQNKKLLEACPIIWEGRTEHVTLTYDFRLLTRDVTKETEIFTFQTRELDSLIRS